MTLTRMVALALAGLLLPASQASAEDPVRAPWNFAPASTPAQAPTRSPASPDPFRVPLFGDLLQFGSDFGFQFQGGFNFVQGSSFNFNIGTLGSPVAVARGAFKVGENGSPYPQDRVFATYNYYDDVLRRLNVHREMLGFEQTFMEDRVSIELRLPLVQNHAHDGERESEVADVTAVLKSVLVSRPAGVLSGGLGITAPTSDVPTVLIVRDDRVDEVHPWLLQPFVGYGRTWGALFVQGISSAMIPTDARDATFLFNDAGVGYAFRRDGRVLRAVVPVIEAHINTPLGNRDRPGFADSANVTAGGHVFLGERLRAGAALGRRIAGPRLFSMEVLASADWRF